MQCCAISDYSVYDRTFEKPKLIWSQLYEILSTAFAVCIRIGTARVFKG